MRYGYFDDEHREYVIERPDVPVSWTNYLGVRDLCAVISHNAGGYIFHKSAEHNRLTRFRPNGVPLDRPGHYVYLRDDDTGDFWSISWQPVGVDLGQAQYEVRHGLSYSRFKCDYAGIHAEQLLCSFQWTTTSSSGMSSSRIQGPQSGASVSSTTSSSPFSTSRSTTRTSR